MRPPYFISYLSNQKFKYKNLEEEKMSIRIK